MTISTLAILALAGLGLHFALAQTPEVNAALAGLQLPEGFHIERFSDVSAFGYPRMMTFDAEGHLLVTTANSGRVLSIDREGKVQVVADGLNGPNGIALLGQDLLVAEKDGVVKLPYRDHGWGTPQPFISGLPDGGHSLKTVKVSPDGEIFVNIGSSCNVCVEQDPLRATLLRFNREGRPAGALLTVGRHAQGAIWASGLRNSQGWAWHPETGDMFATNEGADNRSDRKHGPVNDALPPEHLNQIIAGKHYGWPYCWADPSTPAALMADPNMVAEPGICGQSEPPRLTMVSHSTPIGITFLHQAAFPTDYRQDAIVAQHGSWNRTQPSGYALARVKFRNHQPESVVPFVSGWLKDNLAWGRPVDVAVGPDGLLYVSDDKTGWIYRIRYQPQ